MQIAGVFSQINLRVTPDLKEWLVQQAQKNRRSLTAEIVVRLEAQRNADAERVQDEDHEA